MKPEMEEENTCETPGCDKEAKLQCPTCIKLQIQGSFFCGQECFKSNWDLHKALHKLAKGGNSSGNCSKPNRVFNPWPGYKFTGKLRPGELSDKRTVPDTIRRPDYANHVEGLPLSEQKLKGNTYIRQLDDNEIESLRVACRLGNV
jgi:methionyl aminopeptidase